MQGLTANQAKAVTCNRAMWRVDNSPTSPYLKKHLRCTIKFERCPVQDGLECLVKNRGD